MTKADGIIFTQGTVRVTVCPINKTIQILFFAIRTRGLQLTQTAQGKLVSLWISTVFAALWPVPGYTRSALVLQALIIVSCVFAFQWWPIVPTVAIGFLGVVAAIMTVRADRFTRVEKAVWVLIAVGLFIAEVPTVSDLNSAAAPARKRS